MFRARKQLGKRQTADSGNGFRPKKFRADQQVPTFDDGQGGGEDGEVGKISSKEGGEDGAPSVGRFGRRIVRGQTGNVLLDCEIPRYGTPVERKRCRKAGDYIIGHELGTSPGVPQTQYLARKQGTDEYYLLKILSFDPETEIVDKEALQGKVLLHNEYTLLSMLDDLDGVIHQHGFFSDYAFEERQIENDDGTVASIYTGRIRRRLMLVLDCVHAHEFCERSGAFISLQRYIIVTKYTEQEALQLFYEVVKVVEQLHARNIIHRDLKLNNIVLNRHTNRIVLTNFFLGKQLINEQEVLFDQRGSPAYISPDVLGGKPYKGKPSDIWALGVILYTIIYGKFPFLDTTPTALFRKIREVDYVIPAGFKTSEKTNMLIKSMLTLNPEERFTATEVRVQLEQMLRKMRPLKLDVDQLVPELPEEMEPASSSRNAMPPFDQSIPNEQAFGPGRATPASSLSTRVEPMQVVVDPAPVAIAAPGLEPVSPKYELSTEAFSRVLESNNQRHELGADGFPKPKHSLTIKKVTPSLRFTLSPGGSHLQQYPLGGGATSIRNVGPGGSPNATGILQQVSRSLSPGGILLAGGNGGQRNRFNVNLNVQYSARSRAVAATTAAVRGTGAEMESNSNGSGNSNPPSPTLGLNQNNPTTRTPPGTQPSPTPPPPPPSESNTLEPAGQGSARAQANTSPLQSPSAVIAGQVAAQSLPPAAQRLYAIMNYISHIRGHNAAPAGTRAPLEFNGIITQEIADKIVPYLIVNLRHHERVMDLFRATNGTGGAGDPAQRVNNLLELLRQLGVRMDARNGQIVIRAEQTRERHQFLAVLLRIAGFNDSYFVPQDQQAQQQRRQILAAHPLA
uniref:Serine/threonine-protein kinase 40 n=1 Tax=Anopheles atroparvus TaxID=41427 RepID=A0A182IX86_ANOAO